MAQSQRSILVVEDDTFLRQFLVDQLADLGIGTLQAQSGEEAIGILRQGTAASTLLTDMHMPGGMTGMQLVEIVSAEFPEMGLILTSGDEVASRMPPCVRYLAKPFTMRELARAIAP
jgi:CheY-like chemotaxis protein